MKSRRWDTPYSSSSEHATVSAGQNLSNSSDAVGPMDTSSQGPDSLHTFEHQSDSLQRCEAPDRTTSWDLRPNIAAASAPPFAPSDKPYDYQASSGVPVDQGQPPSYSVPEHQPHGFNFSFDSTRFPEAPLSQQDKNLGPYAATEYSSSSSPHYDNRYMPHNPSMHFSPVASHMSGVGNSFTASHSTAGSSQPRRSGEHYRESSSFRHYGPYNSGGNGGAPVHHSHNGGGRARERKHAQKIFVDGLFPPHIRPASVLIGTRGMNHHRMQSSGCTVQLRGKGCSQPSSQWPEEPVHLYVKYDTESQFARFKEILKDIVEGYEGQNPKRMREDSLGGGPRSSSNQQRSMGPGPAADGPSEEYYNDTDQLAAETELLWLLKAFLQNERSVYLDELAPRIASFFGLESIEQRLNTKGLSASQHQLVEFIRSCPHCFTLTMDSETTLHSSQDIPTWSRPRVSLNEAVATLQKKQLRELHGQKRREQQEYYNQPSAVGARPTHVESEHVPGPSNYTPFQAGYENGWSSTPLQALPAPNDGQEPAPTALSLLLQALHYLIRSTPEGCCSFIGLEERFLHRFNLSLKVSCFGYSSIVAFVKAFPSVFRVTGTGRDMTVWSLPYPDFNVTQSSHIPESQREPHLLSSVAGSPDGFPPSSVPLSDSALQDPFQSLRTEQHYGDRTAGPCGHPAPPWDYTKPAATPTPFPSESLKPTVPDVKPLTQLSGPPQTAPRLLGLLGRLVEQTKLGSVSHQAASS